jgi:hypothetical protein
MCAHLTLLVSFLVWHTVLLCLLGVWLCVSWHVLNFTLGLLRERPQMYAVSPRKFLIKVHIGLASQSQRGGKPYTRLETGN